MDPIPSSRPVRRRCALVFGVVLLQACIYLPRTDHVYDPDCQMLSRRLVLEPVQVAAIQHCANEGCRMLVLGAAVTAAASLVISGTIVVTGNVAYWIERQANCRRPATPALPVSAEGAV